MSPTWEIPGRPVAVIRGIVRSARDGTALPGVRILDLPDPSDESAAWGTESERPRPIPPPEETATDEQGRFRLEVRRPSGLAGRKVIAVREGFFAWARVYVPAPAPLDLDISLAPCAVFRGVVRDPRGRPLPGAALTVMTLPLAVPTEEEDRASSRLGRPEVLEARSGIDGRFAVLPLHFDKDYALCAGPVADAGWTVRVRLRIPLDVPMEDAVLVLEPGGTVVLRVSGVDYRAVEVRIRLLREDGTEAASAVHEGMPQPYDPEVLGTVWGFVECFRNLAPGEYRIEFTVDGAPAPCSGQQVTVLATEATVLPMYVSPSRRYDPPEGTLREDP